MKKSFYALFAVLAITASLISCSEDADPPVAEIFYEVDADDPYTIHFTKVDKNADYITFDNGGFIGIQDFATHAIIREISADRMVLTLFLHSVEAHPTKPSNVITISFDAM